MSNGGGGGGSSHLRGDNKIWGKVSLGGGGIVEIDKRVSDQGNRLSKRKKV